MAALNVEAVQGVTPDQLDKLPIAQAYKEYSRKERSSFFARLQGWGFNMTWAGIALTALGSVFPVVSGLKLLGNLVGLLGFEVGMVGNGGRVANRRGA